VAADGAGDDTRERRLADAGDVLDQEMPVCQERAHGEQRRAVDLDHGDPYDVQHGTRLIACAHEREGLELVERHVTVIGAAARLDESPGRGRRASISP
jgi:hypothetical protein